MQSVNPATGKPVGEYEPTTEAGVLASLERADEAFSTWRDTPIADRCRLLEAVAGVLQRETDSLARLAAVEMGKPLAEGRAEVEKCAWVCRHYAENASLYLADEPVVTDAARSYVTYRPLGPVLAVMPWNFPFWQVFRCVAPALAAGNAVLLKHASNVSGCALAIASVVREAGAPEGLFDVLLVPSDEVGPIVDHPTVRAVSVTGGTPAGSAIASRAGAALKKVVLELGGSDPYVVLADADVDHAAAVCAAARLINCGQSCIAAKRFIVVPEVRDEFEARLVERFRAVRVGDPLDDATDVGPLARHDLRDELHDQVRRSAEAGARVLLGGYVPDGAGAYYPPTALTDVRPGMAAFDEETFGPVAVVVAAADEADAIALANASPFGLGAAVFSTDAARAEAIAARELEAGCCFVNASVRSDPRLPFGGVKVSGFGRELGRLGILEFVNAKTVYVA